MARQDIDLDRLGTVAALVAMLAVGVSTLFQQIAVGSDLFLVPAWLWWASYAVFVAVMLAERWIIPRLGERYWLAALCLSGATVYLFASSWGFTGVCLVIGTGAAPFILGTRGALALIVAQSGVIAVRQALAEQPFAIAFTVTAVYTGFQLFASLMGISAVRESRSRAALAEANDELRAAQALLRESARAGERLRISRDLHDLVGHQLTALALELEVASHQTTGVAAEHVGRARTIAKDALPIC